MKRLAPPLYFRYLFRHYVKNLFTVLVGLSFAFAAIDYFQHIRQLDVSWNYKILYIFYKWEQALGLLYPLSVVFALLMTKIHMIKNGTMGILYALGFTPRRLLAPVVLASFGVYAVFLILNGTSFAYAQDKAEALLDNEIGAYASSDIFFKYNDTFVYMRTLDPVKKEMRDITIFRVENNRVDYTMHAKKALFDGEKWDARDVTIKYHVYDKNGILRRYEQHFVKHFVTLEGYKPKIIESLYEGKSMHIADALRSWSLLRRQHLRTEKVRTLVYEKVIVPLFAPALVIILFMTIPFHRRMMHMGKTIAYGLGLTFVIWGVLFGALQLSRNGVISPETAVVLPIVMLWIAALRFLFARRVITS
jgi:lipopolysaccharide export system permease protein